jgi:hypothetical protein
MGEYVRSTQARFDRSHASCAILEVHHLPDQAPRSTLYSIANALYHKANPRPGAFVLFSDVIRKDSRGLGLAEFIASDELKKVGSLLETTKEINPRTGNPVKVWIFTPNHDEFRRWYTEETMHRLGDET